MAITEDASEEILIDRSKDEDFDAFDRLMNLYQRQMFATALSVTGKRETANDAVVNAMIRVFRSNAAFRTDSKLSTWIHRIVVNCAIDVIRREGTRSPMSLDDLLAHGDDQAVEAILNSYQDAENSIWMTDTCREIGKAIDTLPNAPRNLQTAFHAEEKTYEQLSGDLGVPIGTVKSRLFRARQVVRDRTLNCIGETFCVGPADL